MTDRKYTIMSTICKTLEILSDIDDNIIGIYKEIFSLDEKIRNNKHIYQGINERLNCISDKKHFARIQLEELRDKLVNDESIEGGDFL